jgi:hypothetical protein
MLEIKITIDDGYCSWEYVFNGNGDYSIQEIADLIKTTYKMRLAKEPQLVRARAFGRRIKAGGNMNEWISVKQQLPGDALAQYLVYIKQQAGWNDTLIASWYPEVPETEEHGYYYAGHLAYWDIEGSGLTLPFEITHWMPLPNPPKE